MVTSLVPELKTRTEKSLFQLEPAPTPVGNPNLSWVFIPLGNHCNIPPFNSSIVGLDA